MAWYAAAAQVKSQQRQCGCTWWCRSNCSGGGGGRGGGSARRGGAEVHRRTGHAADRREQHAAGARARAPRRRCASRTRDSTFCVPRTRRPRSSWRARPRLAVASALALAVASASASPTAESSLPFRPRSGPQPVSPGNSHASAGVLSVSLPLFLRDRFCFALLRFPFCLRFKFFLLIFPVGHSNAFAIHIG